jgi:hypothetical protein
MEGVLGINIKNDRVEAELRLLASEWGVGLTEAIEKAVQTVRRLQQDEAESAYRAKLGKLRDIQTHFRDRGDGAITSDHADLYDQDGMPA